MLFLVIPDHKYGERVPTNRYPGHRPFTCDYDQERIATGWGYLEQVHLGTVISKRNIVKGLNILEYNLEGVKGKICTIREVIIPPFMTTVVKGIVNLMAYSKYVNVVVKPVTGYLDHTATARLYGGIETRERRN